MQEPEGGMPDFDPNGPPCAPYPTEILNLGRFRWLAQDGHVIELPESELAWAQQQAEIAAEDGEDPQTAAGSMFGDGTSLNPRTLAFWEEAALRGGHTLSDLLI
ncbi:hypothetical protein SEA_PHARAOH_3 [Mycobacterium phage Pharaoh]|uniref:Uncharacterized protein n=1 Tax=Mycobacterium phage Pharaoh TaxID=2530140 RepID=A0A481W1L2_9CAUD|nr:hypothetical protein KIV59_gp03 [Mycobacterium phage Pharaoh]QBJ00193.1 hypothetical protein SEA_PHARAOH_3 [Mycobacterium phage Pharaoh]